jgi:hypothetical protein
MNALMLKSKITRMMMMMMMTTKTMIIIMIVMIMMMTTKEKPIMYDDDIVHDYDYNYNWEINFGYNKYPVFGIDGEMLPLGYIELLSSVRNHDPENMVMELIDL